MFSYRIKFSHENENALSQEERHGQGQIDIETDVPIETQEQVNEVAKAILRNSGGRYTKVGIEFGGDSQSILLNKDADNKEEPTE